MRLLKSYEKSEAANVMLTRIARWSALKAWASGLRSEPGCVKPRLPSLENLLSFRTGCGSTAPNSNGQRRPPINLRSSTTFPRGAGKQRPCRDAGVGAIAPGFAMLARANRASHIDPPASSYAIMRRACPYRGENPGPGKDVHGELDHRPGIREQNWLICDLARMSVFLVASWVRRTKLKTGLNRR